MKRGLATTFTAVALLATSGWNITVATDDQQVRQLSQREGVVRAADDNPTSFASANANSKPIVSAGTLNGDDPETLRLELIACLFTMLVVSVGALLGICYFDHRAPQQKSPTNRRPPRPPTGRPTMLQRVLCQTARRSEPMDFEADICARLCKYIADCAAHTSSHRHGSNRPGVYPAPQRDF